MRGDVMKTQKALSGSLSNTCKTIHPFYVMGKGVGYGRVLL